MSASWDFFIAHAGPDIASAKEVTRILEEVHGTRCFVDFRDLAAGAPWQRELKNALSSSDVVVVLISRHTPSAWYQEEEVALAVNLSRAQPEAHHIAPVLLGDTSPQDLPYGLGRLNAVREADGGLDTVCRRLVAALRGQQSRPEAAALGHASQMVDQVWSRVEETYTGQPRHRPDGYGLIYGERDGDLVALHDGTEVQRVTRDELVNRLSPQELEYIKTLEKSMEVNLAVWEEAYPLRTTDARRKDAVDRAVAALAEDLDGVLESLGSAGMILDDHYLAVRSIVRKLISTGVS
jgi:hypothetical protein